MDDHPQSEARARAAETEIPAFDESGAGPRSLSVAERVRERILTGEIAPGERLNEVHLARELGVSRTPIRAALHALAAEGLLDYVHNRGFSVREVPLSAMLDAYEIRASLEGLACRFAAERGLTPEQRATIEAALARGDEILERPQLTDRDLAEYRTVNVDFHDTILAAAQNRMLVEAVRLTLNMPGATYRHIVSFTHRDVRRRHDDHHRIFELIEAREGWRAEILMREHVSGIRGSLLQRRRREAQGNPVDPSAPLSD
jgi:GntR family transcriptional regulator of vanillate catabolism